MHATCGAVLSNAAPLQLSCNSIAAVLLNPPIQALDERVFR